MVWTRSALRSTGSQWAPSRLVTVRSAQAARIGFLTSSHGLNLGLPLSTARTGLLIAAVLTAWLRRTALPT